MHRQAPDLHYTTNDHCNVGRIDCGSDSVDQEERRRRALSIIRALSSGVDGLSVYHDKLLPDDYADAADNE
ncbi:MAG: hypothetical protein OXI80_11435 [Caldilineaceae bacterium]|nr:hypothetical protein [Caldilineaceae bacterium]MDE0338276.1 hypothetical protein [Caldilineaceae bacterium]